MPMQYNDNGDVNWFANKFIAFVICVGIMIFCYIVTNIKLLKDKESYRYTNFKSLNTFINPLVQGFLFIVFLIVILNALNVKISINYFIPILIGILLIILGNYFPKVPPNKSLGIKNKWTKKSEFVWKKTHRFTAFIYIFIGLIFVVFGIFNLMNSILGIILIIFILKIFIQ